MGTAEGKRPSEGAPEDAPASKRARQEAASTGAGGAGDGAAPSSSSAAAASAPAAKPPGLSLEALEKAKRALQLQAALKAKLAKLPSKAPDGSSSVAAAGTTTSTPAGAAAAAAASKPRAGPIPLRLDDQGRELDEQGRVIEKKRTAEAKQPLPPPPPPGGDERLPPPPPLPLGGVRRRPPPEFNPYFDPSLGRASSSSRGRSSHSGRRGALAFVPAGRFASEAAAARASAASNVNNDAGAGGAPSTAAAAAAPPRPPSFRDPRAPVPPVEWWDAKLLVDKTSYSGCGGGGGGGGGSERGQGEGGGDREATTFSLFDARNLRPGRVSSLVEHPVPLPPPAEPPPPPAAPLILTARERKKLRTQRRNEREAEKRLLIQQGLLEPPKTKVRLSNMARVLGSAGVVDATAVEATVRAAAAERQAAHEDHNAATRLTPAERREKKARKLAAAAGAGPEGEGDPAVAAALYCVAGPALEDSNKLKFKVRANADELQLTGCAAVACRGGGQGGAGNGSGSGGAAGGFSVVLVEGGPRALKKFDRLMRSRIDWSRPDGVPGAHVPESSSESDDDGGEEEGAMDEGGKDGAKAKRRRFAPSACSLAWRGAVPRRAFEGRFSLGLHADAAACRAALSAAGVPHYFDLVASIVAGGGAGEGGGGGGEGDDGNDD